MHRSRSNSAIPSVDAVVAGVSLRLAVDFFFARGIVLLCSRQGAVRFVVRRLSHVKTRALARSPPSMRRCSRTKIASRVQGR